jgi:hypothetical protein
MKTFVDIRYFLKLFKVLEFREECNKQLGIEVEYAKIYQTAEYMWS